MHAFIRRFNRQLRVWCPVARECGCEKDLPLEGAREPSVREQASGRFGQRPAITL